MKPTILAIESSCDETAAAVVSGYNILSSLVYSQINIHKETGGVVPEVAARAHLEKVLPIVDRALFTAFSTQKWRLGLGREFLNKIDAIAVTYTPGLIGSLLVGVETANALALSLKKSVIPINHYEGHLASFLTPKQDLNFPVLALTVSGGHTSLYLMTSPSRFEVIGRTKDDAAGEAFDKGAKILGLPYPGGPAIEKLAKGGDKSRFKFPVPLSLQTGFDFSFSGLKTALLYTANKVDLNSDQTKKDLAASFEMAIATALVSVTKRAALAFSPKAIALVGGVASNQTVQDEVRTLTKNLNLDFYLAPKELRTDNAAMIGLAAAIKYKTNTSHDVYPEAQA